MNEAIAIFKVRATRKETQKLSCCIFSKICEIILLRTTTFIKQPHEPIDSLPALLFLFSPNGNAIEASWIFVLSRLSSFQ